MNPASDTEHTVFRSNASLWYAYIICTHNHTNTITSWDQWEIKILEMNKSHVAVYLKYDEYICIYPWIYKFNKFPEISN